VEHPEDFHEALKIIRQWHYGSLGETIPLGIFYQTERPTYEQHYNRLEQYQEERLQYRENLIRQYASQDAE